MKPEDISELWWIKIVSDSWMQSTFAELAFKGNGANGDIFSGPGSISGTFTRNPITGAPKEITVTFKAKDDGMEKWDAIDEKTPLRPQGPSEPPHGEQHPHQ